jgi:cytochrome c oxidase subunit 2
MPARAVGSHRRHRPRRRAVPWLAATAGTLLLAGCDLPRFGAPDPASSEGESIGHLYSSYLIAAGVVTLLVWALLGWVLVKYRRRNADEMPSQRAYNIPLEIAYTIVPILIVAVLFAFSVHVERKVTKVAEDPAAKIEVIGFQWGWQFRYPDGFTVEADAGEHPVLVLPVDQDVNLHLVSVDVIHSFWVPNFLSKRDLIPGVDNTITVHPTRTGTFVGRCAEFCGLDHWRMQFEVRIVSDAEYRRWVTEQRQAAATSTPVTTPTTGATATTTTTAPAPTTTTAAATTTTGGT